MKLSIKAHLLTAACAVAALAAFSKTPPAFIAQSLDDVCEVETAVAYDLSLQRAGVSSTAKIYLDGGHGYGLRRLGHATDTWPYEAASWLAQFARKLAH